MQPPSVDGSGAFRRRRAIVALGGLAIAAAVLGPWAWRHSAAPSALDLNGRPVDPLGDDRGVATVLIFTRSDCPISNRYAPEVIRLADRFAPAGVAFWLVYVDPEEGPQAIRRHLAEYGYDLPALRDPEHQLVRLAGARVTPEAAVYDGGGRAVYRGRIDDRYAALDRSRQNPATHDLEAALEAVLAGGEPLVERTQAVGCYIADLR